MIVDKDLFQLAGNNFSFERLDRLHVKGVNRSEHKHFLLLLCEGLISAVLAELILFLFLCEGHDTACDQVTNGRAFDKVLSL